MNTLQFVYPYVSGIRLMIHICIYQHEYTIDRHLSCCVENVSILTIKMLKYAYVLSCMSIIRVNLPLD